MATIIERSGVEHSVLGTDSPARVADRLGDLDQLTEVVRPVLDVAHSDLDADPPVWTLPARRIGPFTLRTSTQMSVRRDEHVVVVEGERSDRSDFPARLRVTLTPTSDGSGPVELVSEWWVELESRLPRTLLRVANRVIDATIEDTTTALLDAIRAEFGRGQGVE